MLMMNPNDKGLALSAAAAMLLTVTAILGIMSGLFFIAWSIGLVLSLNLAVFSLVILYRNRRTRR